MFGTWGYFVTWNNLETNLFAFFLETNSYIK